MDHKLREYIPILTWPPFVVLYVSYTAAYLVGGITWAAIAGLLWFILVVSSKPDGIWKPLMDWHRKHVARRCFDDYDL